MITQLRGMLKSNAYRIFLWIFLAVLLFGGISFDFQDKKPWVIKIYGQKTTELEFRHAVNNLQRQYDQLKMQGINFPRTESLEKETLRHVMKKDLLAHVSSELDLVVPSVLLQEHWYSLLASLPPYFFDAQGNLIEAMFEKIIAPKTIESLQEGIESDIKLSLLRDIIGLGAYVAQFEVTAQCQEQFASKSYSIVTIPFAKALQKAKEAKVSDEVLERFYKKAEHGDLYKSAERRAGQFWKFNADHYGLTVSKADAANYYDQHKAQYLQTPAQVQVHRIYFAQDASQESDARAQAELVHEELKKDPTTFASVAKKMAASKGAHQGSAKTEFFAKDSTAHDKIFVETAFEQLEQDGDISAVIKTDKGYEILQRVARKAAKYKPLHEVEHEIKDQLLQEKFAKRFVQDAQRLVSSAAYNNQALQGFIEKRHGHHVNLGLEVKQPGMINMHLFQTEQGHYAVFMLEKEGILLECTQIEKKALKPFEEIKATVSADYYKKQAQHELEVMVKDAMQDVTVMSMHDLAHKHHGQLQTVQASYKDGQMDVPAVLKKPEIAQKTRTLQTAGAAVEVITATEGYIIVLDQIEPIDSQLLDAKKSDVEKSLQNQAKYKSEDSFVASLYGHAKLVGNQIEIKEQLLKDIKDISL